MVQATKENRVSVKIFLGFELTSEIRIHLAQSNEWKQASISRSSETLLECPYQEKAYLGRYLESGILTISELKIQAKLINKEMETYCPTLNFETPTLHLFPLVLVA
jgi:hypothetical protein